jgi:hypothetical protein
MVDMVLLSTKSKVIPFLISGIEKFGVGITPSQDLANLRKLILTRL